MDLAGRLDRTVGQAIADGSVVGAVTMVARDGETIYRNAHGQFDREAATPMVPEAIFRLASLTKPLIAATALAMADRSLIGLHNAVSDHLPWFRPKMADGTQPKITISQLLTHTSGLSYDYPAVPGLTTGLQATDLSLEENFSLWSETVPLAFEPGTGWAYGPGIDVLGAVIERIHGTRLDEALKHYITGPLGMNDTGFAVTDAARLATPYADGPPGLRRMGEPEKVVYPDGSTRTFSPGRIVNARAFQSGGAGAVGTADDFMVFLEAIRNRGVPILKPETVAHAIQNQIGDFPLRAQDGGMRFGYLGAIVADPIAANRPQAAGTIRWGGVYGHNWFIDFASGISCVTLTNTPVEGNGAHAVRVARAIYDA